MKGHTILWPLVGATLLVGAYIAYKNIVCTKEKAINYIKAVDSNFNVTTAQSMGSDYLIARAKAYKAGKTECTFAGKNYDTQSGKAK